MTGEDCSAEQDTTTAQDKTVVDKQGHAGCSQAESSEISSNVNQVLVETTTVDCVDSADIASAAVTINSLENGTLYVLQPLDSTVEVHSAQNIDCRTLRLLSRADGDEDGASTAVPTVLVAASSTDMISGQVNLAHLLCSAVMTDFRPEPVNQPASTA